MSDPLEGKTGVSKSTGQRVIRRNGQWEPLNPGGKPQVQEASMRSRMDMGLAPMVTAHGRMTSTEAQGNPYSMTKRPDNAIAKMVGDIGITVGQNDLRPLAGVAKQLGGQDFQSYEQAAAAFESQLMPIMSGAAVSPSEARRQIRAALPALGDSPETLSEKGQTREQMLNGAAKARGLPLPYPNTSTWGINSMKVPSTAAPAKSAPVRVSGPADVAKLAPGTVFITHDGREMVRR